MQKRRIKLSAKIFAANMVRNSLGTGAYSELMSDDEHELFSEEIRKIADSISQIHANSIDDCVIQAVKNIN